MEQEQAEQKQIEQKQKKSFKQIALQFLKFTAFSLGAGIIQLVSFTVMNEALGFPFWLAYIISLALSVIYNFTINRRFTFKSVNNIPIAMSLAFLFYVFFAPYSLWLGDFLSDGALFYGGAGKGWNEYLVTAICMVQNLLLEFVWWRFVIFKKSINTRTGKGNKDKKHDGEIKG